MKQLILYCLLLQLVTTSCSNPPKREFSLIPSSTSSAPITASTKERENVLLIHGILMNSLEMRLLGKRLKKEGFNVYYVKYPSTKNTSADNAKIVYREIKKLQLSQLHIVAHSLGGLVTLHLLEQFPDIPSGRIVMMGVPINGSLIAKRIQNWQIISPLLAKSMTDALSGKNLPLWMNNRDWGMIAGNKNFGVATLLNDLPEESDGTVMVKETLHPKQTDHIILHTSHTGLLFSIDAAKLTSQFLKTGRFKATTKQLAADKKSP